MADKERGRAGKQPWTKHTSTKTGKVYYFNSKTNKSTYERPEDYNEETRSSRASDSNNGRREKDRPRTVVDTRTKESGRTTNTDYHKDDRKDDRKDGDRRSDERQRKRKHDHHDHEVADGWVWGDDDDDTSTLRDRGAISSSKRQTTDQFDPPSNDTSPSKYQTRGGENEPFEIRFVPPEYEDGCDVLHPNIEWHRFNLFNELRDKLHDDLVRGMGVQLESGRKTTIEIFRNLFCQFVFLQHASRSKFSDPLLPRDPQRFDGMVRDFTYLTRPKMNKQQAQATIDRLDITRKCQAYNTDMHHYIRGNAWRTSVCYVKERSSGGWEFRVHNRCLFTCNDAVHERMSNRFNNFKSANPKNKMSLDDVMFCLFLRYNTLSALSHQWAMVPEMKSYITGEFGVHAEVFASGFNAQYQNYGSLFYDIEQHFGSMGSFHMMEFIRGSFVANPPYDESMLQIMVERFITVCRSAKKDVTILFGLPGWGKYAPFPPLATADDSGLVVYHQLIHDREVEWIDYFADGKRRIPSHHWYIMSNKSQSNFDKTTIRDHVRLHWIERREYVVNKIKPPRSS